MERLFYVRISIIGGPFIHTKHTGKRIPGTFNDLYKGKQL
jgi:hypothetical protein